MAATRIRSWSADGRGVHHICFGTKPELIGEAKRRLEAEGTRLLDPPNDTPADGLGFRDPDGLLINLRAAEPAPWLDAPEWRINTPGGETRLGKPGHPDRSMAVRPRRLGHTWRFTSNFERQLNFYTRVLGTGCPIACRASSPSSMQQAAAIITSSASAPATAQATTTPASKSPTSTKSASAPRASSPKAIATAGASGDTSSAPT